MADAKLSDLYSNTWNHLTVCKQMSADSFKNVNIKMFANDKYLIYMN